MFNSTKIYSTLGHETLFDQMFGDIKKDFDNLSAYVPSYASTSSKVETNSNDYTIKLAVPGAKMEDLSVEMDRNNNSIEIEYKGTDNDFLNAFKKSYSVSSSVDYDKIEAGVEHGILKIVLPFKEDQARIKIM